jgi:tripartite ATP-independent transporter DctP family solute receptor
MTQRSTKRDTGRRQFIKASAALGAGTALGAASGARAQGQVRTLKFGHMLPPDQIHHKALVMFGDELAKRSNGRMKLDIFPSSQMGSIAEMLQSVQAGSLTMSMAVPAWYSSHMKPLDAFTLPYLVGNEDKLRPALEGPLGREIAKYADEKNFKVVGYLLLGSRHIVNKRGPVHKPADCQGLKLRVINSPVYLQTFRALGANPIAMDPSELYLALQQGVVDGFEYPLPDLVSQKMFEVAKFLSLDRHTTDFFIVTTNKALWNSLSADERGWVEGAMRTASDWQWKTQPAEIANALTRLRGLMQVNDITPENKKLFIDATRPIYKQFEASIGREFLELAIRELA